MIVVETITLQGTETILEQTETILEQVAVSHVSGPLGFGAWGYLNSVNHPWIRTG
ncbi:MAG: hypothetical protein OXH28_05495 [bacterium]|nr:hypothetical protein [bacterium]